MGTTVNYMLEAEDNVIWVITNQGLFRLNRLTMDTEAFSDFSSETKITCGLYNEIYAVKEDNYISYYLSAEEGFKQVPVRNLTFDSVMEIFVDNDNNLWIFTDDGNHRSFSINYEDTELILTPQSQFRHNESLLWCFYEDGSVYFVDATLIFYEYNLTSRTKHYIQDIRENVLKSGEISSIIKHHNDFFIGFANGGLLRIKNMPDQRNKYLLQEIDLKAGVLSLATDCSQDIVWIGTDNQGVYMYFNEASSLDGVLSSSFQHPVDAPLTALLLDANQTLWIGTEGEGLVNIHNFDPIKNTGSRSEQFSTYNSLLGNNSVYAISLSNKDLLWIGTENGMNYYSYGERRIKSLQIVADGKPLKYIRSICEVNDTTLWVTTAGEGVVKIRLAGTSDNPIVTTTKRFTIGDGAKEKNQFTVLYKEDNNTVWVGTQGSGVYKIDSANDRLENIPLGKANNVELSNIYAIHRNNQGMWLGTSNGLVNLNNGQTTLFNEANGLPCKIVWGMLEDNNNNLWMSTNRGIVKFDMKRRTPHLCKQTEEKTITEFTLGSYFKDNQSDMLFFGGINGFVTINENEFTHQEYSPAIHFTDLSIFGQQQNIYDYLTFRRKKERVKLNYDQNVFAVSFAANDYIDGSDYNYFYRLDEQGENWVDNGSSNVAFFTYLTPGTYTLSAKYRNNVTGKESSVYSLIIRITPPWYSSWWAYVCYLLLFALIIYVVRIAMLWQNRKKEQVLTQAFNRKLAEEAGKLKLQFFANIANELYASLTLILNPLRRMSVTSVNENTYTRIALQSTMELDGFIKDMNELCLLENGDRKLQIQTLPVSEIVDFIAESFIDKAFAGNIKYQIKVDSAIYWSTDSYCLKWVISNLLGYTFMHTVQGSTTSVRLSVVNEKLQLVIENNRINIDKEKLLEMFNENKVVEMLEMQSKEGFPVHHELILAICKNMVKLMEGNLEINDLPEGGISFSILLPQLPEIEDETVMVEESAPVISYNQIDVPVLMPNKTDPDKKTILVFIHEPSLLWLLTDQLASSYNIEVLEDASRLFELLEKDNYSLFISEAHHGPEFVSVIKQKEEISLPCIFLASKNTLEEKCRAIEAGADLYIEKPFNMNVLEREMASIIQYQKIEKQYIIANRTFVLGDETFATTEERTFYNQMLGIIDSNLDKPELSVEMICHEMNNESQQFYARLKGITRKTPNEIIREYRLNVAEVLLASTTLPVDEIIKKVGFSNRNIFFKVFSQRNGMTPRSYREQHKKQVKQGIF